MGSKDVTPQIVTASSAMHASMLLLVLALYLNAPRNICPNGDHKGNLSKLPPDCHLDYCCIILWLHTRDCEYGIRIIPQ